jgi:hypothetical protein
VLGDVGVERRGGVVVVADEMDVGSCGGAKSFNCLDDSDVDG